MAAQITSYGGLRAGVLAWLARSGDSLLDSRFDDFLLNCERRIYYGFATEDAGNPLRSDPLRIVEMETVDPAFALSAVTPQPATFLELISAQLNSPNAPMQIVAQRTIDGYGDCYVSPAPDQPRLIAISGTNFRVYPDPGSASYSATLRYYQKLSTPAGSTANAILLNSPDVYLYGCLIEAAIFTQDADAALRYLPLYNASVAGLNARTQRITASSVPVMRLRAGMIV
ncbi:MAG: hypothetical protein JOY64_21510 [Alphaproteobacteria bacterium]|nr:hypothetical protein [Alphaproteobacteria bacterium]